MISSKVPVCQALKKNIKSAIERRIIKLEDAEGQCKKFLTLEIETESIKTIQLDRVNGLKRRLFLIIACWCSREANFIQ
ncbi:hypothetical protein H5410_031974, partial [Solanum commersonii]